MGALPHGASSSSARLAATNVGAGSASRAIDGLVAPVSTIAPSMPGGARAGHVGVEAIADRQRAARRPGGPAR